LLQSVLDTAFTPINYNIAYTKGVIMLPVFSHYQIYVILSIRKTFVL